MAYTLDEVSSYIDDIYSKINTINTTLTTKADKTTTDSLTTSINTVNTILPTKADKLDIDILTTIVSTHTTEIEELQADKNNTKEQAGNLTEVVYQNKGAIENLTDRLSIAESRNSSSSGGNTGTNETIAQPGGNSETTIIGGGAVGGKAGSGGEGGTSASAWGDDGVSGENGEDGIAELYTIPSDDTLDWNIDNYQSN